MKKLLSKILAARARSLYGYFKDELPQRGALLDIGSGTGHLGSEIIKCTSLELVELDIADTNLVNRPPVLYDGKYLEFEDNVFSCTLMAYMIHYADAPETLIQQALRVSSGKVIIFQNLRMPGIRAVFGQLLEFFGARLLFSFLRFIGIFRAGKNPMIARRSISLDEIQELVGTAGGRIIETTVVGWLFADYMFVVEAVEQPKVWKAKMPSPKDGEAHLLDP